MRRLYHHLRHWGLVVVVFAAGCGDDERPGVKSSAGSSGAPTAGATGSAGTSNAGGQAGNASVAPVGGGGSSEALTSGGAGGEGAGAWGGGAGVAGTENGGAPGDGDAGAGGAFFGCMSNPAACPEEPPENTATCAQSMADAGIFCAYASCTQACVCNGMQTGAEPSFAWLCFPIGE